MTIEKRYEEYEPLAYNSQLKPIAQPEFGRNIQRMIEKAIAEPNRDTRNKMALAIIDIMGHLNPQLRDVIDFKHKLWDNLFIISDFKLNVDSPYPIPDSNILETKPEKVNYPSYNIKYRHYGKTIDNLIVKARAMKEGEEKNIFIEIIANMMKRSYLAWNRDSVTDDVIFEQLSSMSNGELKMDPNKKLNFIDFRLKKTENPNFKKHKSNNGKKKRY
jgi:hypothetical protein